MDLVPDGRPRRSATTGTRRAGRSAAATAGATAPRYHVVAVDYGAKRNILRLLGELGCAVTVVPATATAEEMLRYKPDGVFLSNGPGDPAATGDYAVPTIRGAARRAHRRCSASASATRCSGWRSAGAPIKMAHGHRGANHPVKDLTTGKVEIVSMNHGFAVDARDACPPTSRQTHVSLFDGSNCGIALERPAGLLGAVPSRGLAGAARQPLSVPPLRRHDGQGEGGLSRRAASARQFLRQAAHEGDAGGKLRQGEKLVGLVRLVDRAGAAQRGRQAGALEMASLAGERNGDDALLARQAQRQRRRRLMPCAASAGTSTSSVVATLGPET